VRECEDSAGVASASDALVALLTGPAGASWSPRVVALAGLSSDSVGSRSVAQPAIGALLARYGFDPGELTPGGSRVALAHRPLGANGLAIRLDEVTHPALGRAHVEPAFLGKTAAVRRSHLGVGVQGALFLDAKALAGGCRGGGTFTRGVRPAGSNASTRTAGVVPGAIADLPTRGSETSGVGATPRRRKRRCGPVFYRGCGCGCISGRRDRRSADRRRGRTRFGDERGRHDGRALPAAPYGHHATKEEASERCQPHGGSANHAAGGPSKWVWGYLAGGAATLQSTGRMGGATLKSS